MLEPHDPVVTVRAGGVAPLGSKLPDDERASPLSARAYAHPAIAGRVVVRLEPEAVAAGADAEMRALGFEEPEVAPSLGQVRYRTLGFPAWPLVHDPKKARFALEVTQELRKAKQRAAAKPGHAKEAFEAIAKKLGRTAPHFLPSFWEECARALAGHGATAMAAQCFERAREAERAHKLKVDEAARDAVFVELALLGAVAAKTLSAYAKDLEKSAGPKDAYRRFRAIVAQRALGGMPPWSGMGKDLRALAKAAKLDLDAEDDALVRELVDTPSLRRAPAELWTTYRPSLLRVGADPRVRARLRALFPEPRFQDDAARKAFLASWYGLLEEVGALDDVPDAELADFVSRAIRHGGHVAPVRALLPRFAPRLAALGARVKVAVGDWYEQLSLDYAEQALSAGVALADPKDEDGDPLAFEDDEYGCDPIHVAKDPVYGELLVRFVEEHVGDPAHEAKMRGKDGFRAARRAWLEGELEGLGRGLRSVQDTLAVLEEKTTASTFLEMPDLHARMAAARIAPALERTLRAGIADELGWEAYEAAFEGLGDKLALEGFFPYVVAHDGLHARVIGPEGVVLRHDFAIDAKKHEVEHAYYLDGDLLVLTSNKKTYDDEAYWAAAPKERFELRAWLRAFGWQTKLQGGGVTLGHLPVHAGDRKVTLVSRDYHHDGHTFFVEHRGDEAQATHEWDPRTNEIGRKSRPTFFEQFVEEGARFEAAASELHAAPDGLARSILGVRDGLVGVRVRRRGEAWDVERIDGVRWTGEAVDRGGEKAPEALVLFPGDDRPRLLRASDASDKRWRNGELVAVDLYGPDGEHLACLNQDAWASAGWGRAPLPPREMWHFLSYRDEAGSRALRAIDRVEELMRAAPSERAAILRRRGVTNEKLIAGVSGVVEHALALEARLAELVAARSKEAAERGPIQAGPAARAVRALSDAFAREKAVVLEDFPEELREWLRAARGKATRARMPFAGEGERTRARELLSALAGTVFEDDLSSIRLLELEREGDDDDDDDDWGTLRVTRDAGSTIGLHVGSDWAIERSSDGVWRVPNGFTITRSETLRRGPGAAFVRAWLALDEAVAEWRPAVAERIAERTGLPRAEAILLAAGLPSLQAYARDFLGKERREALGLKVTEADLARGAFRSLEDAEIDALFDAAIGDDPRSVLAPLEPDASGTCFADRLADVWLAKLGRRVELPAELLEAAQKELDLDSELHRTLSTFAAPDAAPRLVWAPQPFPELVWGHGDRPTFDAETGKQLLLAAAWLAYARPVGDAVRAGVPAILAKLRALLGNQELVWPLGHLYSDRDDRKELFAAAKLVHGEAVKLPDDDGTACEEGRDDGATIVGLYGHTLLAGFRPAKVERWDAPALVALQKALEHADDAFAIARTIFSDGLAALAARVAETKVEEGRFEADPTCSAPRTVAAAKKALGVSDDAAALYLQLLALAEPTDRAIRRFNGWTPKRHQAAQAELVKKKLVTEGKRERAGREVFLPGGWSKGRGKDLPTEDWKKPFYPGDVGRNLPLEPMHALFARAWKRVESGDAPRLEKVR